jgi:tetratricopeptide (TPR) repeat protein
MAPQRSEGGDAGDGRRTGRRAGPGGGGRRGPGGADARGRRAGARRSGGATGSRAAGGRYGSGGGQGGGRRRTGDGESPGRRAPDRRPTGRSRRPEGTGDDVGARGRRAGPGGPQAGARDRRDGTRRREDRAEHPEDRRAQRAPDRRTSQRPEERGRPPRRRTAGGVSGRPDGRAGLRYGAEAQEGAPRRGRGPRNVAGDDQRAGDRGSRRPERERGSRDGAGGDRRPGGARSRRPEREGEPRTRAWGGLARRAAGRAGTGASDAWRAAGREGRREGTDAEPADQPWQPDEWIDEGELRDEAEGAVGRGRSAGGGRPPRRTNPQAGSRGTRGPRDAEAGPAGGGRPRDGGAADAEDAERGDLRGAVPANRAARFESRLKDASTAFRRERYEEARRILRPLAEQAPGAAPVRELYGLTLYRLGRWAQASRQLEAFRTQTGSTEQNPVLADCARALGRYDEVEELWDELRAASPSAELVAEGRIVTAGALADQGRLDDAIRLLEAGTRATKRPQLHHLRMSYALADLIERAGDLPRARELFGRVAASDPDFVDIQARLRALR